MPPTANRNVVTTAKMRHSVFIAGSSAGRAAAGGLALELERLGRGGGGVVTREAGRRQRLRRGHAPLLGRDEPVVDVLRDGAELKVHHRVVRAAQFRTAADVPAL